MPPSNEPVHGGPHSSSSSSNGRRRKSTGFFARSSISSLTPIHSPTSISPTLKKKRRPPSFFMSSSPAESDAKSAKDEVEPSESFKPRPRIATKNGRPSSIFGSLRAMRLTDADELSLPMSRGSSVTDEASVVAIPPDTVVLHHSEVQTTGGMFRKRKEYLVLTEDHLIRFKNQSRAADAFPS